MRWLLNLTCVWLNISFWIILQPREKKFWHVYNLNLCSPSQVHRTEPHPLRQQPPADPQEQPRSKTSVEETATRSLHESKHQERRRWRETPVRTLIGEPSRPRRIHAHAPEFTSRVSSPPPAWQRWCREGWSTQPHPTSNPRQSCLQVSAYFLQHGLKGHVSCALRSCWCIWLPFLF